MQARRSILIKGQGSERRIPCTSGLAPSTIIKPPNHGIATAAATSTLGRWSQILARVGRADNGADGFLIETFEAAAALQILQMTAKRAFLGELCGLLRGNQAGVEQRLQAIRVNAPAFSLRKRLPEKL